MIFLSGIKDQEKILKRKEVLFIADFWLGGQGSGGVEWMVPWKSEVLYVKEGSTTSCDP